MFRPVILLPEEPLQLSLSTVLTHELAHLKRGDHWWNLVSQSMFAILFFQPLLRLLVRRLEIAAEEVCDDHVVNFGGNRIHYADGLVALAEQSTHSLVSIGVPLVTLRSLLARRVRRILDRQGPASLRIGRPAVCGVLCAGLLITVIGGFFAPRSDADASVADSSADENDAANKRDDASGKIANNAVKPLDEWLRGSGKDLQLCLHGEVVDADGRPATSLQVACTMTGTMSGQPPKASVDGNRFKVWMPVNPSYWAVWLRASSGNSDRVAYVRLNKYQLREAAFGGLKLTLQSPTRQVDIKVTDQGQPVSGATVNADLGFGIELRSTTGANGIARLAFYRSRN